MFDLEKKLVDMPVGGGQWKIETITPTMLTWAKGNGWFNRIKMEGEQVLAVEGRRLSSVKLERCYVKLPGF